MTTNRKHEAFSPTGIGLVHFVGIGGIGMSGIAEIMHHMGYKLQGSDLKENANVTRLREKGVKIIIGHAEENIKDASVVVISSAVKEDNPEVIAARKNFTPVIRRAEMLGELMRLKWAVGVGGTHGKTTTTSMVATLFDEAGLNPTVINGGIINAYGTNARLGTGDWMVVEADESDGSFTKLPATVCIITNMDPEHLDHYKDFDAVRDAYRAFVENIPFYGFGVLCIDHPEVQALVARVRDRKILTYGFSPQADVRAVNVVAEADGTSFDVHFTNRKTKEVQTMLGMKMPIMGRHNVQNVLSALAIGWHLDFDDETLRHAFRKYKGVKRRFTCTGKTEGVTIIDDYAHHPVEIKATLESAAQAKGDQGRVIAIMQPHRYSRLKDLMTDFCTCFNDADTVIISEVFAAGEKPIEGASQKLLVDGLRAHGHRDVHALDDPKNLAELIATIAKPNDYVICLGAGSISRWAHTLPDELAQVFAREAVKKIKESES